MIFTVLFLILFFFGATVLLLNRMIESRELKAREVTKLYPPSKKPIKNRFAFSSSDYADSSISKSYRYEKNKRWKKTSSGKKKKFNKFIPKFKEDEEEELI